MQNRSPTFKYFEAKITGEGGMLGLSDLRVEANVYIRRAYPYAHQGSNFYFMLSEEMKNAIPLTDQYFLRAMTFRSCIPPYKDEGLDKFERDVLQHVKESIESLELETTPRMGSN